MPEGRGSVLHQQALTVVGFFTGLVLTSLVLILNSPGSFHVPLGPLSGEEYFQIVTTYVAVVGAVSAVAMLAFLEIAGGMARVYGFVDRLGTTLFFLSVFGFMGVLPLVLVPYTRWGAGAVLGLEVTLLLVYFVGRLATRSGRAVPPSPEHSPSAVLELHASARPPP